MVSEPRAGQPSPPTKRASAAAQLIIKFRAPDVDLARTDILEHMFRDTGVRLIHLRHMSAGAHVFRIEQPLSAAELDSIMERLRKFTDIEYVEPDRLKYHQ